MCLFFKRKSRDYTISGILREAEKNFIEVMKNLINFLITIALKVI